MSNNKVFYKQICEGDFEVWSTNGVYESTDSKSAGGYPLPFSSKELKWKKNTLKPFVGDSSIDDGIIYNIYNIYTPKPNMKKLQSLDSSIDEKDLEKLLSETFNKEELVEDLAVWFGTKKKPKGSKQPKGPWVNICRKVNGKHPPCGRSDTSKGAYPKCRAAGVAGKMSDSQKRAACAQKRKAEKSDTQSGKGQKPVMTSYKPRKESIYKKKVLTEKFKIEPYEREKLYEDTNFLLVIPLTHTASCKYGANTKWCTSSSDDTMFKKHNRMGSLAYLIIKNKDLQEKLGSEKFGLYINKPGENYLGGRYPGPDGLIFYDEKNDIMSTNKIMNLFDRVDLYGIFMTIIGKFTTYSFKKFKELDNLNQEPKD